MVLEGCHSLHLYQLLQVSPLFSLLLLLLPPSKMFSPDGPGSIQPLWSPTPMDSSNSTTFPSTTVNKHCGTVMSKQRQRVYTSLSTDRNRRKSLSEPQKCILPSIISPHLSVPGKSMSRFVLLTILKGVLDWQCGWRELSTMSISIICGRLSWTTSSIISECIRTHPPISGTYPTKS